MTIEQNKDEPSDSARPLAGDLRPISEFLKLALEELDRKHWADKAESQ